MFQVHMSKSRYGPCNAHRAEQHSISRKFDYSLRCLKHPTLNCTAT